MDQGISTESLVYYIKWAKRWTHWRKSFVNQPNSRKWDTILTTIFNTNTIVNSVNPNQIVLKDNYSTDNLNSLIKCVNDSGIIVIRVNPDLTSRFTLITILTVTFHHIFKLTCSNSTISLDMMTGLIWWELWAQSSCLYPTLQWGEVALVHYLRHYSEEKKIIQVDISFVRSIL